jgi:hypothetical protein
LVHPQLFADRWLSALTFHVSEDREDWSNVVELLMKVCLWMQSMLSGTRGIMAAT